MTSPDRYQTALSALDLPTEWQVEVAIRPHRRSVGIQIKPGGTVAVLIPPNADPQHVTGFVGSHRRWISENVDTAARLAPNHAVKRFIDGEEFDLLGQRYRLHLVDTLPTTIEHLPAITPDGVLYVGRQLPAKVGQTIIGLYRQIGLAWMRQEGRQYEVDDRIAGVTYAVRDLGRHRWGLYNVPPKHTTTLHWAVFGLPIRFVEYVLVHEQAHATRPGGRAHGPAWQRRMSLWMPDWQQRQTELAEVGRHCWLGDHELAGLPA
jgi:predicted metal-dependent hydrolase